MASTTGVVFRRSSTSSGERVGGRNLTDYYAVVATTAVSVSGACISAFYANRLRRANQVDDADRIALRFREPVLQAAFNLQSRLFNIVQQGFFDDFLTSDEETDDDRAYAVRN